MPLCFRSSCQKVPQRITNFGNGALGALAQGREGIVPLALMVGLLLAGMGGITAAIVRRS